MGQGVCFNFLEVERWFEGSKCGYVMYSVSVLEVVRVASTFSNFNFLKDTTVAVTFMRHCNSSFVTIHTLRSVYTRAVGCRTIHKTIAVL